MKNNRSLIACALVSMAIGVGATTSSVAEDAGAMAKWRDDIATKGYTAVSGRQKLPDDVRQALWKAYREHIGIEPVQMAAPRLVATNEWGAIYDLPFVTADAAHGHFGAMMSEGAVKPLYRTAEGLHSATGSPESELDAFVAGTLFTSGESRVCSVKRKLSAANAVVTIGFAGDVVPSPFDEYYFFFADDCPLANWGHPARCVFVKSDLSEIAVLHVSMPAKVTIDGLEAELAPAADNADGDGPVRRAASRRGVATGAKYGFSAETDGDAANCHALIISGGGDLKSNHGRYWNDVCFAYNVLRQRFMLPRQNIKVLWASGNPEADLCWKNDGCGNACSQWGFYNTNLSDFDEDGNTDITGAASRENVATIFRDYSASLKATDQLFVFVTDHGSDIPKANWDDPAAIILWNDYLTDCELAELSKNIPCPVMFALETCYSGGMRKEILESNKNRVVATADGYDSSTSGNVAFDIWTYNFLSALCGHYPAGYYPKVKNKQEELEKWLSATIDVRATGDVCNADRDGDGKTSFYEAALFAIENNPRTVANGNEGTGIDDPKYSEGTANLGKKLFMTQYADSPTVVVKEKVMTPALNPSSGSIGYAPATVTASCGTPGATIRYTTDGSEPTARSAVYSGGIVLSRDATVSVRAFKSGMDPSGTAKAAYTIAKSAPQAAMIMSVSQGDSSSGIVVCWSAGAGTDSCDLLRSESSAMTGPTTIASGLAASVSTYADLSAVPGKTYYYQIRSVNTYGKTLSAASLGAWLMLNPPANVTASVTAFGIGSATVGLSWGAAPGATHYRAWRKASDGTMTALGSWQTGLTFSDTVPFSGKQVSFTYYVKSAASSTGSNPSAYSKSANVVVAPSTEGWDIAVLDYSYSTTKDYGTVYLAPGGTKTLTCRLRYEDGSFDKRDFLESPQWSVIKGTGISVSTTDGTYDWSYRPPQMTIAVTETAPEQIATLRAVYTTTGGVITRDVMLVVSAQRVPKSIAVGSPVPFLVPGESTQLDLSCVFIDDKEEYGAHLPEETEISWTVVGGGGATLSEDGVLTAWPLERSTNVTVQASIDTLLGLVVATRSFDITPATITEQTAVIPPIGGASTNLVGMIPKSAYCNVPARDWISSVAYHGADTTKPESFFPSVTLGHGPSSVSIRGRYMFISFVAGRNPGKDRQTQIRVRWSGGGINFTVIQREAPYANDPVVSGGANGTVTANSTTDGSVLHYATDGEEPSESSPVLDGVLDFTENTVVAAKAFGAWMQPSGTVYADVVGRNSMWDEIVVSFDPGQAGISAPRSRTYKVNETFGDLPVLKFSNGMYFKGWTLHAGTDKRVSAGDSVPSVDATLHAVWSPVLADKPEWVALPWNFTSGITAYALVSNVVTGAILPPGECSIGIEDGEGGCRGSTDNGFGDTASPLNGQGGMHVFGVYGDVAAGASEELRIRVWGNGKGFFDVVNPSFAYTLGAAFGVEANPLVISVRPGSARIEFDANGGTGAMAVMDVDPDRSISLPRCKFAWAGKVFSGWALSPKGSVVFKDGWSGIAKNAYGAVLGWDETLRLYAVWTPATYTVVFNANGGTGTMARQTMTYGKAATISANKFKLTGYVFAGWATKKGGAVAYKNAQSVKNLVAAGKSVTLYAVWAATTYKVAFYGTYAGVTGKMAAQSFTYGKEKKLFANKFKRKGYKFVGWAKSKAAAKKGKVAYKNKQKVKNLVANGKTVKFYAVWKKK